MKKKDSRKIGFLGECWVQFKLAQRSLKSVNLSDGLGFDYDLLVENGLKIEVKTSVIRNAGKKKITKSRGPVTYDMYLWQFCNTKQTTKHIGHKTLRCTWRKRDRDCDFFALVCLDKNLNVVKNYIVPKNVVGNRSLIAIHRHHKGMFAKYLEKWDLLS